MLKFNVNPGFLLKINIFPGLLLKLNIKPDWLLKFKLETAFLAVKVSFSCVSGLFALEGPAIRGKSWIRECTRRPEEKPFPVSSCLAGSKLDRPAQLSCCWRLQKNCSQPTKIAQRKKLLTMSKFIVSKDLLNKFAQGESNLLTENQICSRRMNFAHGESWIALHSTCNLSMDAWHHFYLHTNCSKRRKFAHSKEKLLTKIKFPQSKKLVKNFAHSRNLLAA